VNDAAIRIERIRKINDQFRQDMPHGSVRISHEVGQRFSNDELRNITRLIQAYDTFGPNDDPDELYYTGIIEFEGVQLVWQIYGSDGKLGSEFPAITNKTATRGTLRITLNGEKS
jgi:hypothetical protein